MASLMSIGITDNDRKAVVDLLQALLADEYILFTKLFKYHWNVKGRHFGPLHELFQKQYEALFERIDEVAERTRQLGFDAVGTLHEFIKLSHLSEKPGQNPDAEQMIKDLLDDHQTIICKLRHDVETCIDHGDMGTSDFLTGLMENHEKEAWFLRAHLEA